MRPIRLVYLAVIVVECAILSLSYLVFSSFEGKIRALRLGYLHEVTQVLEGPLSEASKQGPLTPSRLSRTFHDFESLGSGDDYDVALQGHPHLHLVVTTPEGQLLYDSQHPQGDAPSLDTLQLNAVRSGQRETWEARDPSGTHTLFVVRPILSDGQWVGSLMASKTNLLLKPLVDAVEKGLLLMLASSGLLILIGLITSYLFLYRHLERWLRPMDSEREPHSDARSPMMRRSHFGRLGQLLDRAHEAISGKRAMEHMVAFLAHEMKNPISAVQLHLDLLERTTDPDTRFRLIQDIREANARMARVTGRLLEIGAIERQSRIGSFEVISLRGLLESVMEQQSEVADRCEVRLQRTDDGDGEVRGDRTLLEQALGNLIQNAIDYSSPGDTVELEVEIHEQQIDIRVRDHGSGIPMEALNQIFDKYFSLPKQSSGRKGTGIGLSVVQEVADLHHGNIALLNHKDGGVLAVLTLPR